MLTQPIVRGCQSCPVNVRFWRLVRLGHRHFCIWALSLPLSFFVGLLHPVLRGPIAEKDRERPNPSPRPHAAVQGNILNMPRCFADFVPLVPRHLNRRNLNVCGRMTNCGNTCAAASFKLCRFLRIFDFRQKAILLAILCGSMTSTTMSRGQRVKESCPETTLCHGQGWVATLQMHGWRSSERSNYGHNPQSWKATVRNHTFCTPRIEQHLQILFASNRAKKTLKPVSPRDQGAYTVYTLKS